MDGLVMHERPEGVHHMHAARAAKRQQLLFDTAVCTAHTHTNCLRYVPNSIHIPLIDANIDAYTVCKHKELEYALCIV